MHYSYIKCCSFVITNLNSLVPMPTITITTKLFRLVNFVYISELIHFGGWLHFYLQIAMNIILEGFWVRISEVWVYISIQNAHYKFTFPFKMHKFTL